MAAAAQCVKVVSYTHAWKVVATMNAALSPPLVEAVRGGSQGRCAIVTRQGQNVLGSFRRLEQLSRSQGSAELDDIGRAAGHLPQAPSGS